MFQTGDTKVHGRRLPILVLNGSALLCHVFTRLFSIGNPAVKKAVLETITSIIQGSEPASHECENRASLFISPFLCLLLVPESFTKTDGKNELHVLWAPNNKLSLLLF